MAAVAAAINNSRFWAAVVMSKWIFAAGQAGARVVLFFPVPAPIEAATSAARAVQGSQPEGAERHVLVVGG